MTSDQGLRPFVSVILGVALFSLMDAALKGAALAVGAYSTLLLRALVGVCVTTPASLAMRQAWPGRAALKVHLTRGPVAALMGLTWVWGVTKMPLAEGIALSFIAPLIALYLAAAVLGETVSRRAVGASLVALAGVVVIAVGHVGGNGPGRTWLGLVAILVSSVLYAWNLVLQRQQALLANPLEVATFQNAITALVLVGFAPWFAVMPSEARVWGVIIAASALGLGAAMIFTWAYARAEAQALVPLEYTAFVWASLFGWLFFAEPVRPMTLVGVALIVVACLIAAPRKRPEAATL